MSDVSLDNLTEQLEAASDGKLRKQLMESLTQYRNKLTDSKQQLLEPDEYKHLDYLERALNAALKVISRHTPVNRNTSDSQKKDEFDSIFRI